ncbi:MAG: LysR family transcriptional regulator [Robiginitomaculum sp.]
MSLSRDLTMKQIRAYAAVARTGSITKASEELFVTPPAISSQIKLLKSSVGFDILTREQNGLKPTQIGLELLALYDQIDACVHIAAQRIEALKAGKAGSVSLAVVSTGKYFAPTIIKSFMNAFPNIDLNPIIGNRQIVLKALQDRSVDVAIMGRPPAKLDVVRHELGDHPNILIAAPDHPLAQYKRIDPKLLLSETLLLREPGSGTRMLARRFMEQIGEGIGYPTMQMNSNESIKQSVMAGLGIAMISEHTVMAELQSKRLVALEIKGLPIIRKWILVRPANVETSGATRSFYNFILENRSSLIPGHLQLEP